VPSHHSMLPGLPPLDGHGGGTDSQGAGGGHTLAEGASTQTTQMRLRAVGRGSGPAGPDQTPQAQTRDGGAGRPWPPLAPSVSDVPPERPTSTRLPAVRPAAPPGSGELSATALRPAVRRPAGGWDTMSSMLSPGEGPGGRDGDNATVAGDDQPSSSWLRKPLGTASDQLEQCKAEYTRVRGELDELRLLMRQNTAELEKLNQRKVLAAARVREIEEHIELHSRQDIRTAYVAASEAEMRVLMITEQHERFETKLLVFERYEQFLSRLMETLNTLRAAERAAPAAMPPAGWSPMSGPLMSSPLGPSGALQAPAAVSGHWPAAGALSAYGGMGGGPPVPFVPAGSQGRDVAALGRVIEAQEHERKRVAQRLHDGPAQSLANIVLTAEICEKLFSTDPRRALVELGNLKGMVTANLQETRKYIFELRPMALDDLGLVATLRRYTADAGAQHRVQVQLSAPQGERPLRKEIEVPVFRVAQEAITNALQHSRATVVQVAVTLPGDGLLLVVEDNGIGFDVEEALARAIALQTRGIVSMQERAEILGGWLRIESTPGRGSRIELSVPS
jgi:two-component system, NarL family, sensor histidine kinase DegS